MLIKLFKIYAILLCALLLSCTSAIDSNKQVQKAAVPSANKNYQISGKVANQVPGKHIILLEYDPRNQSRVALDTTTADAEGNYQLNYTFKAPTLLEIRFFKKQRVSLVIGEGQEKIVLNVDGLKKGKATVSGSKDSELLLKYEAFRVESFNRLVNPTYDAMDVAEEAGDEQGEVDAVEAYAVQNEIHRAELIDFAKKNIGTSLALYGTMLRWTGDDNITALDELVTDFEKVHPDLFMAKEMRDKVERFKKVALGVIAPDIDLIDLEGNSKKLSEVDADYILIDFWASWCGPCLLQTPDLRKAHKAFKDKGFEIYSVSIDTKDKAWKRAIEKHQLQNWTNVIDTRGWGSEVANDYNVSFVPYNFLIDRNRKIIAKNLQSKSLHNKLKKLAL